VKTLLIGDLKPAVATKLKVTSPAFADGQDMPFKYTSFRDNIFPGVAWSAGPAGTRSYVVAMQGVLKGGDDEQLGTSVHFFLFNIPAGVTKLDMGLKTPPAGAVFGATVHGFKDAYVGPHTHSWTKHAYHLEVFALDTVFPADAQMTLAKFESAMAGHVLASGEVIGWAGMDPTSPEAKQLPKDGAPGA
jgi:para-nitrobenzyl esterase